MMDLCEVAKLEERRRRDMEKRPELRAFYKACDDLERTLKRAPDLVPFGFLVPPCLWKDE